jgi:hypothetical protein
MGIRSYKLEVERKFYTCPPIECLLAKYYCILQAARVLEADVLLAVDSVGVGPQRAKRNGVRRIPFDEQFNGAGRSARSPVTIMLLCS